MCMGIPLGYRGKVLHLYLCIRRTPLRRCGSPPIKSGSHRLVSGETRLQRSCQAAGNSHWPLRRVGQLLHAALPCSGLLGLTRRKWQIGITPSPLFGLSLPHLALFCLFCRIGLIWLYSALFCLFGPCLALFAMVGILVVLFELVLPFLFDQFDPVQTPH